MRRNPLRKLVKALRHDPGLLRGTLPSGYIPEDILSALLIPEAQYLKGRVRETARLMRVSPSTISRWARKSQWKKSLKRKRRATKCREIVAEVQTFFQNPANQASSLRVLQSHLNSKNNARYSYSCIRRCLKSINFSRKRLSNKVLGKSNAADVEDYKRRLEIATQLRKQKTLFVSVDECHFSEKVVPLYGYSPVGQRCKLRNKKGSWKAHSLILSIASNGLQYHKTLDGSVKKVDFENYVLEMPFPRGTVLILDNCSIHKNICAYETKGYVPLFLPPYSPQFQPVELAFSKVKGHFRQMWPLDALGVRNAIQLSVNTLAPRCTPKYIQHVLLLAMSPVLHFLRQ